MKTPRQIARIIRDTGIYPQTKLLLENLSCRLDLCEDEAAIELAGAIYESSIVDEQENFRCDAAAEIIGGSIVTIGMRFACALAAQILHTYCDEIYDAIAMIENKNEDEFECLRNPLSGVDACRI